MRIAAANARPRWGQPAAGADRVAEWIAQAGEQGNSKIKYALFHEFFFKMCCTVVTVAFRGILLFYEIID